MVFHRWVRHQYNNTYIIILFIKKYIKKGFTTMIFDFLKKHFHKQLVDVAIWYFLKVLGEKENKKIFINELRKHVSIPNLDGDQFEMMAKGTFDVLIRMVLRHVEREE